MDLKEHEGIEYAGYLSFVVLLSIFPFFIFLTTIASNILSVLDRDGSFYLKLLDAVFEELPHDTMYALLPRINEILSGPPHSLLTMAIIGVVWSASSAIEGMRNALNKAFRVSAPPPYVLGRMFSILQFFVIAVMIVLSLVCVSLVPIVFEVVHGWKYLKHLIMEVTLFVSILWLYFTTPNTRNKLSQVVPGALLVTLLWSMTSIVFSWYLSNFSVLKTIYGNLTGIIASLLFFYILSIFFIYGAEFNYRLNKHLYL